MELYFTFPGWRKKALSFSYDDGTTEDRRLVDIFNKYNFKGTFNISPGRLGGERFITAEEMASLYEGHEVASHGFSHLHLNDLPPEELKRELQDGRSKLEDILGRPVVGFASPYGHHSPYAVSGMREAGFLYARPGARSKSFTLPNDFMRWFSTIHHRENSAAFSKQLLSDTAWGGKLLFLNIFGHSYEFNRDDNWSVIEEVGQILSNNKDIWYVTNLDMCNYISAMRSVKITLDGTVVENCSSIPLYANWGDEYGTKNNTPIILPPGTVVDLKTIGAKQPEQAVVIDTGDHAEVDGEFALTYPNWKRKALTFSYDDAHAADRRLVEIFNRYGMRGTFNVNSKGRLKVIPADIQRDSEGRPQCNVTQEELPSLYKGHEIALHGAQHETYSSVPWPVVLQDISRDKEALEGILNQPVRGFAYPCGASSKTTESDTILSAFDVAYARLTTPPPTDIFALPKDFYSWHPTAHHNGNIAEIGKRFLDSEPDLEPLLCYIWGHSFEFDGRKNWNVIEEFCAAMAGHDDIWYTTNIAIYDYITASRKLRWSLKKDFVTNPTATTVYGLVNGNKITIPPHATVAIP